MITDTVSKSQTTNYSTHRPTITHLVSLDFFNQVFESWQAAESNHGLTLLSGQTLHLGKWCACQYNLLTT